MHSLQQDKESTHAKDRECPSCRIFFLACPFKSSGQIVADVCKSDRKVDQSDQSEVNELMSGSSQAPTTGGNGIYTAFSPIRESTRS